MSDARPDPAQGIFETLRVHDGRAQGLPAHLERLATSLRELYGLGLPPALGPELQARAVGLAGEHRLRVDVDRHGGFTIVTSPAGPAGRRPVALTPVVVPGGLGGHKWRDRRLIDAHGADPVPLLVDAGGEVLEVAWGNFWIADGDRLLTPPADGRILPGVTRAWLLELAPGLGLEIEERPIGLAEARGAAVAFVTSALRLAVAAAVDATPPEASPLVDRIRSTLAISGASC